MKLILIHGSPAVGKLTVANEIACQIDFKVFHNHLTIDAVQSVFDFGTEPFWRLVHEIRVEIIAEAARQNIDLIYTFCYAKDSDDTHVEEVTRAVAENGGEICFVLLVADKSVIEKRVIEPSRLKYRKLNNLKTLHEIWERNELFSPINGRESIIIDNTNLSPKEAALKIIEHFSLKKDAIENTRAEET